MQDRLMQFTDGNRAYFADTAQIQAAKGSTQIADAMRALPQRARSLLDCRDFLHRLIKIYSDQK
jgi:hypothetical protein